MIDKITSIKHDEDDLVVIVPVITGDYMSMNISSSCYRNRRGVLVTVNGHND